jgi:N-acetylglucosamine-6-phosphate deacetylase
MTITAIVGARILTDGVWHDDHAVLVGDGKIISLVTVANIPEGASLQQLIGGMLVPGFIDTQVNGGGGVLFNDQPTVEGIITIAKAHRRFGTTAMLPTLISDELEIIETAIMAVDHAIMAGVPGIIGIHIEGPFLNAGKRGIHDDSKFRTLDAKAVALLSSLKHGKTLVTLAPETAPSGTIASLVQNGVIVAAGHTLANYDEMQRSIAEGVSGVTHLFNAMTQLEGRAPGVVGAAFESDLICGIIADGHHVHPATLRAAYRAKGAQGLMLVTDAMPTVGSNDKSFSIGNTSIIANDGKLTSTDGTLAGSYLDMASAIRNCMTMLKLDLPIASQMARQTPAKFVGLSGHYGCIAKGYSADMVRLNKAFEVCATWIAGKRHTTNEMEQPQ